MTMTWVLVGLVAATAVACLYRPRSGSSFDVQAADWLRVDQLKRRGGEKTNAQLLAQGCHPGDCDAACEGNHRPDRPPVI